MALRHVMLHSLFVYSPVFSSVATIQQVYAKHRGPRIRDNNFFSTLAHRPLFVSKSGLFEKIRLRANTLQCYQEQRHNSYTPSWIEQRNVITYCLFLDNIYRFPLFSDFSTELIGYLIISQILVRYYFGKSTMILNLTQPSCKSVGWQSWFCM